jgi:hypothetical protein
MSHPKARTEKRHEHVEADVKWSRNRTSRRSQMRKQSSSSRVLLPSTRKLDASADLFEKAENNIDADAQAVLEQKKDLRRSSSSSNNNNNNNNNNDGSNPSPEGSDTSLNSSASGSSFEQKLRLSPKNPPKRSRSTVSRTSQSTQSSGNRRRAELRLELNNHENKNKTSSPPPPQRNHSIVLKTRTRQHRGAASRNNSRLLNSSIKTDLMELLQQNSSKSLGTTTAETETETSTTKTATTTTTATPSKKRVSTPRRSGMKKLLRNKRKIEQQLHDNELFQFVLHKSRSIDKFREQQVEAKHNAKISLDKFMKMKETSEQLWSQSNHNNNNNNNNTHHKSAAASSEDTWGMGSICFSQPDFGDDEKQDPSVAPIPDDDDDDMNSVVSLELNDVVEKNESPARISGSSTSLHAPEMESQTLSLEDLQHDDEAAEEGDYNNGDSINGESSTDYVGEFAVVDPAGRKGIYTGTVFKSSGMPCGQGRLEYPDRGEIFEGQFVHGFWTGYGRCIYTNTGEDYTGFFHNNIKHGHGVTKYQDGRVYNGTYSHGVKVEGKMTYQDGSTYLGEWSRGARNGRGTYTFPNGSVFFGEFLEDKMYGSGVLTWASGGRCVGGWKNGLRHGYGKDFRPDGSLRREGTWTDGKLFREP